MHRIRIQPAYYLRPQLCPELRPKGSKRSIDEVSDEVVDKVGSWAQGIPFSAEKRLPMRAFIVLPQWSCRFIP